MATINMVFNGVDNVSQIVSNINQQMQNAEKSAGGLTNKLLGVSSALQIFSFAKNKVDMLTNSVSGLVGEYQHELEMETRLATVMQARFGASGSTISAMKDVLKEQAEDKGKKQGNQRNENALDLQSERLHRIPSFKLPYIIQHFQAKRQQIISISAERMGRRNGSS